MRGRRFLLLVALLMGVTAVAASLAPPDPSVRRNRERTAQPTPSPAITSAPVESRTVERTLDASQPQVRTVRAHVGDLLRLEVRSAEPGAVAIEGLDRNAAVDPSTPALFEVFADAPGSYPIVLVDDGRRVGTLVIR